MTSKHRNHESLEAQPQVMQEHATVVAMHAELSHEAQTAALRELTGWMAHHMRSPLAAIQAACSGLKTELEDPDQQERLELTLGAVDRMLRIISTQIGNYACVRRPQQPTDVDIGQHATEIVSMFSLAYPHAGKISLVQGQDLRCRIAPLELRIALFSLLSFAVKETAGAPIRLVIEKDQTQGGEGEQYDTGEVAGERSAPSYDDGPTVPSDGIGLLVAERFARDVGGKITHRIADGGIQVFMLKLPHCDD